MPIPRQSFEPDREGPLRGVRVLDFSRLVAGNMLSLQLADFGAEVVKVVFEQAAQRARQLGCEGAGCIHPAQVTVLNRVFTPDPAKVEYVRRVVEAFEDGVRRGTASVNLDGKMVDVPVYKRAQVIMARARAVADTERRKAEAARRNA